jgi:DNA-binding transcriptional MerR regulator
MTPRRATPEQRAATRAVSAWRASRGPRGQRLGWSSPEAAAIVGVPVRTLQHWAATGLVSPTGSFPEAGVLRPLYVATDLFVIRVLRDCREAGLPEAVISQLADEIAELHEYLNVRDLATGGPDWLLPRREEWADRVEEAFGSLIQLKEQDLGDVPDDLADMILVYPVTRTAQDLVEAMDQWWDRVTKKPGRRPPWM